MVEIPIFEMVLSSPFAIPAVARACASSRVSPGGSQPRSTSSASVSSIRYGFTAAAP